jgi:hypothetical protein
MILLRFADFVSGHRVNRVLVGLFVNNDNVHAIRCVPKEAWSPGSAALGIRVGILDNEFDVGRFETMLGNMLYVAVRVIFAVPDDAYESRAGNPFRVGAILAGRRRQKKTLA